MKITSSKLSKWAGILSVPPLLSWYLDHLPGIHAQLPAWTGQVSLTVWVALFVVALIANAAGHAKLDRVLSSRENLPARISAATVPLSPVPSPAYQERARDFVPATAMELTQLFVDHVSAQADKLIQPYLGKWLRVQGEVKDVFSLTDEWGVILRMDRPPSLGISTSLRFNQNEGTRLQMLPRGSMLTVIGQISRVERDSVWLHNCEIVNV